MFFELHCHTNRSDGLDSPEEMVKWGFRRGLKGVAITDHDKLTIVKKVPNDFVFVPGEEVSTAQGHLNALGISEVIKPGLSMSETIDLVHEQGGVSVINHPFCTFIPSAFNFWDYKATAVEVCNGIRTEREVREVLKLARRKRVVGLSGTDAHFKEFVGRTANFINASSVDELVKRIKRGEVRPKFKPLSFEERFRHLKMVHLSHSRFSFLKELPDPVLKRLLRTVEFGGDLVTVLRLVLRGEFW